MKYSRLLQWGKLLFALAILFFLIKRLYSMLSLMEGEMVTFQPLWLIASLGLLFSYRTLLVYPWRTLYCSVSQTQISFQDGWTLFQLSQLGKYLPGKVGQFASIIALCRPLKLSKTAAVVSTLQSVVLQCALGVGIGVPVLLSPSATPLLHNGWAIFHQNSRFFIGLVIMIIGGGCVAVILLHKGFLFRKMEGFQEVARSLFSLAVTPRLLGMYLLLWCYFGIAFFLFLKSMGGPTQLSHLLMIIGIYPLAWSLGILSLVTPGGLGVRESILSVLLALCLPPANATLMALLSRVWVMSVESLLASIAWCSYCKQKLERQQKTCL
ncbi:hypothetical protein F4X10_00340 [Candidatus Poribacteria bacterium]|nr:hypothetical protein [Candidatus Poribacteria bacterium]